MIIDVPHQQNMASAADLTEMAKAASRSPVEVLPRGMTLAQPVVTQAKYFYRFECESDGQKATETIGFQTHRELLMHMIANENDEERQKKLSRIWNVQFKDELAAGLIDTSYTPPAADEEFRRQADWPEIIKIETTPI